MNSLETVAEGITKDSAAVTRGELTRSEFLTEYGHLRPGSYEITSLSYAENSDQYLSKFSSGRKMSGSRFIPFSWKKESVEILSLALENSELDVSFQQFDEFLRVAIEGREYAKFIFSRNLSASLNLISEFGKGIGLDRERLSHISIGDFEAFQKGEYTGSATEWLSEKSDIGKCAHEIAQAVELPPLLISSSDIEKFEYPENQPNFISLKKVTAPVEDLTEDVLDYSYIQGKIVFVPQADPGFDWLFSHSIAGLVTKYGGANSHMAIRAAEFGLPAAIGLGEVLYNRYSDVEVIELDCAGRQIKVVR